MSTEPKEQTKALNPLKKLDAEIASAKSVKDLLKIDIVSNRYIANYQAGTGLKDGKERYEREAFAFMELANSKPEIMECDPVSIFAGFIKAGVTGLSFSSSKLSVYPRNVKQKDGSFKKFLVVTPDAHGKKEMMERMPSIKKIDEGVLIFTKDEFKYDSIAKKVTKHEQVWPRPEANETNVEGVYCTIHFTDGHREEILLDRHELKKARDKSTNVSYVDGQKVKDGGELWRTHYGEACKKSTYNRAHKVHYKVPETAVIYQAFESPEEPIDTTYQEEKSEEPDFTTEPTESMSDAEVVVDEPKEKEKPKRTRPTIDL